MAFGEQLPPPPEAYDPTYLRRLVEAIDRRLRQLESPAQAGYAVANLTASRTLDCTGATLAETRQVVGTLIQDLKTKGRLA